ncbi:MAG: alpha/beta fold hydrolase [Proteobacteria bacterium]|nr:alpha/beta fold hydrolase [Pseudomonadota bacterium]
MIPADETFDGTWPFQARYFDGHGFRQHYIDEGQADSGETFVLLHGEPTWGYLFRKFVAPLAARGRVVVPDHMGFGKSETPQDRDYSYQDHCENLEALLLHLDLRDTTLVMHDWGGMIGGQFAFRHSDRVDRVVVLDTFVSPPGSPLDPPQGEAPAPTPWFELVLDENFGPVIQNLRFTILSVLQRIGIHRGEQIDDNWVRAYAAPFPTPADCKGAQAFPLSLLQPETYAYVEQGRAIPGAVEALRSKPALAVWGEQETTVPREAVEAAFRTYWPDGPLVTIPGAAHYTPEDAPETLVALIEQFVQATG